MINNEKWSKMTPEELVVEYQATRSKKLFDFYVKQNRGLIIEYIRKVKPHPKASKEMVEQMSLIACHEAMIGFDPSFGTKFSTFLLPYFKKQATQLHREYLPIKVPRRIEFKEEGKIEIVSTSYPEDFVELPIKEEKISFEEEVCQKEAAACVLRKIEDILNQNQFNYFLDHVGLTREGVYIGEMSFVEISKKRGGTKQNTCEIIKGVISKLKSKITREEMLEILCM